MSSRPSVFVIIVTYNGALWIRQCLESLRSSTYPCTPIVVDNASSDGTQKIVRENFPEALLLEEKRNHGFGISNNIGIAKAFDLEADYVFLLNQDAYVLNDTIEKLISALQINTSYLLATPIHCSPGTNHIDINTRTGYLQRYCPDLISDACLGKMKEHYPITGVNAAAWLISKNAILKIGGFDPLFFMYGEDDDLINRYAYHGLKFILVTKSLVVHLRQKPPSQKTTWLTAIKKQSMIKKSKLLVEIKNPNEKSYFNKIISLICNSVLRPTIDILIDRDITKLIAHYIAFLLTLNILRRATINANKCKTEGPHFIFDKTLS